MPLILLIPLTVGEGAALGETDGPFATGPVSSNTSIMNQSIE